MTARKRLPLIHAVDRTTFDRMWSRTSAEERRSYEPLEALGYLSLWDGKAYVFVTAETTEVIEELRRNLR